MLVEWEITLDCNFNCPYCGLRDVRIRPILDERKLTDFIASLKSYKTEIFCFGGEPFLHPKIDFIIRELNRNQVPYVIQTNLSPFSFEKLVYDKIDVKLLQVSIHPLKFENLKDFYEKALKAFRSIIRQVSIMFLDERCFKIYELIVDWLKNENQVSFAPIGDFKVTGFLESLRKFNLYARTLYKLYRFETPKFRYAGKLLTRSEIWEGIFTGRLPETKGKPCIYKNRYILFAPNLEMFNCSYRIKHDGICPNKCCFFM
jgi:sulfatase maturation enzyme AslB (radical SAM superfamily)